MPINARIEYLVETFIKRSKHDKTIQESLDFTYLLLRENYPLVKESVFADIKKRHNLDEYIKKAIPIILEQFSEAELMELISFHESSLGKKATDIVFLQKLIKVTEDIVKEAEQELTINNA